MFCTGIRRTVLAFAILTMVAAGCGGQTETPSLEAVLASPAPASVTPAPSIPFAAATAPTPTAASPSATPTAVPSGGRPGARPSSTPDAAASELAQIDGLLKGIDGSLSDYDAAERTGE